MTADEARVGEITQWLRRMGNGDAEAPARAFELLRDELHGMAHRFLARDGRRHTLQATALVNELYLRVHARPGEEWKDRGHFLAVAAKAMRCILRDHHRGRRRIKRVPPGARVSLSGLEDARSQRSRTFLDLDAALDELAKVDPLAASVVEHRFILGMSMPETARTLGCALRNAERKWRIARAFLHRQMQ